MSAALVTRRRAAIHERFRSITRTSWRAEPGGAVRRTSTGDARHDTIGIVARVWCTCSAGLDAEYDHLARVSSYVYTCRIAVWLTARPACCNLCCNLVIAKNRRLSFLVRVD